MAFVGSSLETLQGSNYSVFFALTDLSFSSLLSNFGLFFSLVYFASFIIFAGFAIVADSSLLSDTSLNKLLKG